MSWQRGDLADVFSDGTRTAVFVDSTVLVLSELASAILAAVPADGTAELPDITAAVISTVGSPPSDPESIVRHQITDLVGHGILQVVTSI